MLYHLLKSTLHPKANACSIGTFITFYMQSSLYSKANACNIGTFIRFYIQMRVQIKNKAFAYRFYRPFTQQCIFGQNSFCRQAITAKKPFLAKFDQVWSSLIKFDQVWSSLDRSDPKQSKIKQPMQCYPFCKCGNFL